jgi:hypothetical protein
MATDSLPTISWDIDLFGNNKHILDIAVNIKLLHETLMTLNSEIIGVKIKHFNGFLVLSVNFIGF